MLAPSSLKRYSVVDAMIAALCDWARDRRLN